MKCHWCGEDRTSDETGPYGPSGEQVCIHCIESDTDKQAIALEGFWNRLREALESSSVVIIDDNKGPRPWHAMPQFRTREDDPSDSPPQSSSD